MQNNPAQQIRCSTESAHGLLSWVLLLCNKDTPSQESVELLGMQRHGCQKLLPSAAQVHNPLAPTGELLEQLASIGGRVAHVVWPACNLGQGASTPFLVVTWARSSSCLLLRLA